MGPASQTEYDGSSHVWDSVGSGRVSIARRELFKRLLRKGSAEVLRLFAGTAFERLVGIGGNSQPSAEEAGLALRRRRTARSSLMPSGAKSCTSGSRDDDTVPAAAAEAEPRGSGDDGGTR
jgi:hypothetical protein